MSSEYNAAVAQFSSDFIIGLELLIKQNYVPKSEHSAVVFDYENKLKIVASKDGMANRLLELFADRRELQEVVDNMFEALVVAYDANLHPNSYNCDCVCCATNKKTAIVLNDYKKIISPFISKRYQERVFA